MRGFLPLPPMVTIWEILMHEEFNKLGFPELMTEAELMRFL
jgi:hypothetical protein